MAIPLLKVTAEIRRLKRNLTKRANRIRNAGVTTNAMNALEEIKNTPATTAREKRRQLARLETLNKAQGLKSQTAQKVARREAAARDREELISDSKNGVKVAMMKAEERRRAAKLVTTRLEAKVKYANEELGGSLGADAAQRILDEAPNLNTATANELAYYLHRSANALDYKTLTRQGVAAQEDTFKKVFGKDSKDYTKGEQSALWNALKVEQAKYSGRYSSWAVAEEIQEIVDKDQKFIFRDRYNTLTDDNGNETLAPAGLMAFFTYSDLARAQLDLGDRGIVLTERGTIPVPLPKKPDMDPREERIAQLQAKRYLEQSKRNNNRPI